MSDIQTDPIFSARTDAAGRPVRFPTGEGQVDVTLYEIPPGAVLPAHKHPFPRMGYMLAGTLRVTDAGTQRSTTYTAGDFAVEAVDVWHKGETVGVEPVRILVIDLVAPGAGNVVLR